MEESEDFFSRSVRLNWEVANPHKRLQHLAVRYLLLDLRPDFPLDAIALSPSQKPMLPDGSIQFSFSHSRDFAAVITSEVPVGIDVEAVDEKVCKVSSRFLDSRELEAVPSARRIEYLTLCWCAKEAIYKWAGVPGLSFREDIDLNPFLMGHSGIMSARVRLGSNWFDLQLPYILESRVGSHAYGLVWVESKLPDPQVI